MSKITNQQKVDDLEAVDHGLSLFQWLKRLRKWVPGKWPTAKKKRRWEDGYKDPPEPAEHTCAPPGTLDKIEVMIRRRRAGKHLYHHGDLPETPIALAQKGNTTDTKNGRCTAEVKKKEGYQILIEAFAKAKQQKEKQLDDS